MALFSPLSLKSTHTKARSVLRSMRIILNSIHSQCNSTEPSDYTPLNRVVGLGERLSRIAKELDEAETKNRRTIVPRNFSTGEDPCYQSEDLSGNTTQVEISHPWPEWISLIDCLVQGNYFAAKPGSSENGGLFGDSHDGMPLSEEKNRQSFMALSRGFSNFARHRVELLRIFIP